MKFVDMINESGIIALANVTEAGQLARFLGNQLRPKRLTSSMAEQLTLNQMNFI